MLCCRKAVKLARGVGQPNEPHYERRLYPISTSTLIIDQPTTWSIDSYPCLQPLEFRGRCQLTSALTENQMDVIRLNRSLVSSTSKYHSKLGARISIHGQLHPIELHHWLWIAARTVLVVGLNKENSIQPY
jgi:hypothetical protein